MSFVLRAWLFLGVGVVLALLLARDTGYVLISYDVWVIELSVSLLLALMALAFVALYVLMRLMAMLRRLPRNVSRFRAIRGEKKSHEALTKGLVALSEGSWRNAETQLLRHASDTKAPLLNYLAGARAAQMQGDRERRDNYLRQAEECAPKAKIAVGLTQAELQLADGQIEQALATIKEVRKENAHHPYALRMLKRIYEEMNDWEGLARLLPMLRKHKIALVDELDQLELKVQTELLDAAAAEFDERALDATWQHLPRPLRNKPELIVSYVGHLIERNEDDKAEPILRDALKKQWHSKVVLMYGQLDCEQPGKLLEFAESLLKKQDKDESLLLTLGRLSLRAKLWGKARSYLEASLVVGESQEACLELGRLLQHLGEKDAAMGCYRRGLVLGTKVKPISLPKNPKDAAVGKPVLAAVKSGVHVPAPHGATERLSAG